VGSSTSGTAELAEAAGCSLEQAAEARRLGAANGFRPDRVAGREQLHCTEEAQATLRSPETRSLLAWAPWYERAILSLMIQGRTDTEIQTELALPADAFSAHLRSLLARLGYRPAVQTS
jgi:DNA-binding NarL/FixJ family response regulator